MSHSARLLANTTVEVRCRGGMAHRTKIATNESLPQWSIARWFPVQWLTVIGTLLVLL